MILYCDTSALIKRYVEEDGTENVNEFWDSASAVATSVVAFAEAMSVFNRKLREGVLSDKEYRETAKEFKADYKNLLLVPVNDDLNVAIENLLKRHPLRGFDAIHLASAMVFIHKDDVELFFACFDHNLNQAARKEELNVIIKTIDS
ncbi:MAG: type II toxin-antitoxin system VapC family toxin [Nitrospirota bacterium]